MKISILFIEIIWSMEYMLYSNGGDNYNTDINSHGSFFHNDILHRDTNQIEHLKDHRPHFDERICNHYNEGEEQHGNILYSGHWDYDNCHGGLLGDRHPHVSLFDDLYVNDELGVHSMEHGADIDYHNPASIYADSDHHHHHLENLHSGCCGCGRRNRCRSTGQCKHHHLVHRGGCCHDGGYFTYKYGTWPRKPSHIYNHRSPFWGHWYLRGDFDMW
ncbi:hypothetical protein TCON_1089 [Astathelohania contejeani]|uniref:Uncharacterized protein n=1 Tax=Astathelohania contejeani TaxID=164912 RepID=A0ABQ7HZY3_9MICR|nr:hypothetical protein TCON_1089 [Thelohania contejeani]